MTVVLENQVRNITTEIIDQFGSECFRMARREDSVVLFVDAMVRAVIAQYDISKIERLEPTVEQVEDCLCEAFSRLDDDQKIHNGYVMTGAAAVLSLLSNTARA